MTEHVRVAVIGGGIVGCSILYHLARQGWTESLLLERGQLTAGSTWHAAGNVTHFGHYTRMTRLYADSIRSYLEAEAETGYDVGFHRTGSLRLATTPRELSDYTSLALSYRQLGIRYSVVDPGRALALHPLLDPGGLHGAAHTPDDGHVDPSAATHAMARAARQRGTRIVTGVPALSLRKTRQGEWEIATPGDNVLCEHVVLANSFWAREFVLPLGLSLPLYALEHHEIITGPVAELERTGFELPTVRDPDGPANVRQEGGGLLCGVYESNPKPWALDGIPSGFGGELLESDLDRLHPHLSRVARRIPAFAEAGIKTVNNGPICYTPDGLPLLGPVDSHPGLWLATGFCVGIGTGGGSGRYLAEWMAKGRPPYELPEIRPSRFPAAMERDECVRKIVRTYARGYR